MCYLEVCMCNIGAVLLLSQVYSGHFLASAGPVLILHGKRLSKFQICMDGFVTEINNLALKSALNIGLWYMPVHAITNLISPSSVSG